MEFWLRPVYIRVRIRTLLILLLALTSIWTGIILYRNYVFQNLFLKNLSTHLIEEICIYQEYQKDCTALDSDDTQAVISCLNGIRLKEEPYKDFHIVGDRGNDYLIRLKNGKSFVLNMFIIGDQAYYVFNQDTYPVEHNENFQTFRTLHEAHMQKYYAAY